MYAMNLNKLSVGEVLLSPLVGAIVTGAAAAVAY